MRKKISYNGCDPSRGLSPRLKVASPVFASATDAYNHFVRHPEDFPFIDEDDDDNLSMDSLGMSQACSDVFDQIDSFVFDKTPRIANAHTREKQASRSDSQAAESEGNVTSGETSERSEAEAKEV